MRKKINIIFMLLFLVGFVIRPDQLYAQQIKVISATSQGWSGGVCCRTGIDYHIQLKIHGMKSPVKLDSMWMEGYCVDISKYTNNKTVKSDTGIVIIYEGVRWDEGMPNENWCYSDTRKGVIISYFIGDKKKILDVTPYIKELEYQAYP